jgi:DNA polymerase V
MKPNPDIAIFRPDDAHETAAVWQSAAAGFPSPAMDFMESRLNINRLLIQNEATTFYVKVSGDSMIDAGISDGDILVVDRSLDARDGAIAVCALDGGYTVKRLRILKDGIWLVPENDDYPPMAAIRERGFSVWGVVTHAIRKL